MPACDVIVIGGSAGGLPALTDVLRGLPNDLPAAVLVVIHTSPGSPGVLPEVLSRAGPLHSRYGVDGERIQEGIVYVAPPDQHMLVDDSHIRISHGPKENRFRPAVDPLFRSAAESCGRGVIGVVLSGALDDGSYGLMIIKRHGGIAIAQDPAQAAIPSMPSSAIANVRVDHVAESAGIASLLAELVRGRRIARPSGMAEERAMGKHQSEEKTKDPVSLGRNLPQVQARVDPPSVFTCPDCGGSLWEIDDGGLLRFRCHVGHAYTGDGLLNGQEEATEDALWSAVRALEEHAALRKRFAERMDKRKLPSFVSDYTRQALESERKAALIRGLLMGEAGGKRAGNAALKRELKQQQRNPPRSKRTRAV